jgi:hypothetical protein
MAARPPEVGEQTDEVLVEFGFSSGEIAVLKRARSCDNCEPLNPMSHLERELQLIDGAALQVPHFLQ